MTQASNRSLLITGGTGGLGTAVVRRLAAEYTCYVLYRSEQAWQSLVEDVGAGERLHGVQADLADAEAVQRSVEHIRAGSKPLYGLVHLAGGFEMGSVQETPLERWNQLLATNLTGAFTTIQAVLPQLREQNAGRIITIGSAVVPGRPGGLAGYVVSKAGLNALTEVVANELKDTAITANILLLGSLATPSMLQHMGSDQLVPLERVADTIAFLLSDAAANISGASIPVIVKAER